MGIISKGILGGFSGTVGTVIGGTWKGISYMRSQPARRTSSPTEAQLEQQIKFALATRFVAVFSGLFMLSFRNYAVKMTGTNNALSYLLKNAITGTYPDYSIDYNNLLISRGDLPNALNPAAAPTGTSDITFTWTNNSGTGKAKGNDKAILVIYCPALKLGLYTTGSALRSAGTEVYNATVFAGQQVQTYIGFISEDGRDVASSIYTGQLTVND